MGPQAKTRFLPINFRENVYQIAAILRRKILKNFSPMERRFWYDESTSFGNITEISSKFLHPEEYKDLDIKMPKEKKTEIVRFELKKLSKKFANHIYLPTNPNTKILEIIADSAFSLQSAKKVPFMVSFIGQIYDGPDSDYLAKEMNINEFIRWEIMNYFENLKSNQMNNAVSQNLFDVFTIINSRAYKSTTQSYFRDN